MRRGDPEYPHPTSEAARRVMLGNRSQDTSPEVLLRSALHQRGLRFRKHRRPVPSLRSTADVVFGRARVAVFVDGCFWHRCPRHGRYPVGNAQYWRKKLDRNVVRDRANDAALRAAGWGSHSNLGARGPACCCRTNTSRRCRTRERCRPQHRWTTAIVFDPTQTTLSWYVATSRRSQGRAWRALAEFGNLLLD